MRELTTFGWQGDVGFFIEDGIPEEAVKTEDHIIAHSESGHHHVIENVPGIEIFNLPNDPLESYIRIRNPDGAIAKHLKNDSTAHKPINLCIPEGQKEVVFRIQRGIEMRPKGWGKMID